MPASALTQTASGMRAQAKRPAGETMGCVMMKLLM
jgi:hypothetical protein